MARFYEVEKGGMSAPFANDLDGSSEGSEGSAEDLQDMMRMGYKPELKRTFRSFSLLGLTMILINTWIAVLPSSEFSLINGGLGGTVCTYLATWVCQIIVAASLAEMASMAPTAGGQYHWTSEFAPRAIQKPLSYLAGWLSALSWYWKAGSSIGWQTFVAGATFGTASNILIMAELTHDNYSPQKWHTTVIMLAMGAIAVLFNAFAARKMALFETLMLGVYILGFFAIAIPLWVLAPKALAKEVFFNFQNYGGWSSIGAACAIGQSSAAGALLGVDSAAHMSEEVKNASRTVPKMMFLTILFNGALGFAMLLTYLFAIQNVEDQIVNSMSPYPFIEVLATAINSHGGAVAMITPIVIMGFVGTINAVMAASRQAWSFSRDGGMPFSKWFLKVTTINSTPLPLNAMGTAFVVMLVFALLNLGGNEIVQSLLGLLNAAIGTTYILSIGCVLWRRLRYPLPPSHFSLGRLGVPINAFSFLYQAFATITSFFPLTPNVTAKSMNWSVAVFGGVAILCLINYAIIGRKSYREPVVRIVRDD